MGSTSPQIKSFISMTYEYHLRKSEKNMVQLQRQLQILSVVSDLSVFEPTNMGTLEFFVCLQQLIKESDPRSPLVSKVINLLTHISRSSSIQAAMRDEMQLLPVISQFLLTSKLNKEKTQKILQLLQELSYGVKIRHREAWLIKIIPYLVAIILESENHDDGVEQAVITLANLCRRNPPVVTLVQEYSERKLLLRKLTSLKSPSIQVQLLVSEILIYINIDHSKLGKEQILHTLYLLFMVATDGLADQNEALLQLSNDVFEEIVLKPELQDSIKSYSEFDKITQNIMSYITDESNPRCIGILFQLMSHVVRLEHADVIKHLNQLLVICLTWLPNKRCGTGPQKLLQALLLVADDTIINSHAQDFVQYLKEGVTVKDDLNPPLKTVEWICSILNLVETLCSRDASFHLHLAKTFAPPTLSSLLHPVLALSENEDMNNLSQSSRNSFVTSTLEQQRPKCTLEEACAECVVRILTIVKQLSSLNPEFRVEFREMLGNSKVMQHLVCCERSNDISLVTRATNILCNESVPNENLNALIKAQTEANNQTNIFTNGDDRMMSDDLYMASQSQGFSFSGTSEETVDRLISKLNGAVEKAELKDIPLTQVMELYEFKLAALAHNEITLQEALTASDSLNREMKLNLMKSKAESARVRSLLRVWEERLQHSHKEKTELEDRVFEIKESARKLRNELVKEKTSLEREVANCRLDLTNARRTIESKEEENRKLQRQLSEAIAETKAIQRTVRQEQEAKQKLSDVISKLEEDKRKAKKEYDDLEKENAKLDKMHVTLKKENSELELLIRSHEETLMEKESQIERLSTENSNLKKIQDMIHNISSGKK